MLKQSFIHIPGIGPTKERSLWERGIRNWEQLHQAAPCIFKDPKKEIVLRVLEDSQRAYDSRDLHYFYQLFPKDNLWRLLCECDRDHIAFLDIETTGLGFPPASESTVICFYFHGTVYQEHEPEKKAELIRKILSECSLLVTYFGEAFDVPFLEREFGIPFKKAHIDLCFWLRRLGFKGGLKRIQKNFPDIPARESLDIDGYDAVRLWRLYRQGTAGALETLLTYNAEDTIALEPLLFHAYNMEIKKHESLHLPELPFRPLPELLTRVHPEVYAMLRSST